MKHKQESQNILEYEYLWELTTNKNSNQILEITLYRKNMSSFYLSLPLLTGGDLQSIFIQNDLADLL